MLLEAIAVKFKKKKHLKKSQEGLHQKWPEYLLRINPEKNSVSNANLQGIFVGARVEIPRETQERMPENIHRKRLQEKLHRRSNAEKTSGKNSKNFFCKKDRTTSERDPQKSTLRNPGRIPGRNTGKNGIPENSLMSFRDRVSGELLSECQLRF